MILRNALRITVFLPAFVPLLIKGKYVLNVWRYAPLDVFSPVYALLALLAAVGIVWKNKNEPFSFSFLGAFVACVGVAGCVIFLKVRVLNLPYLFCALTVLAGWVLGCLGWRWFWRLLPVFGLFALSLPSVPFLLGGALMQMVVALGIVCVLLPAVVFLPVPPEPPLRFVLFAGVLCAGAALVFYRHAPVEKRAPLTLVVDDLKRGVWIGNKSELTSLDRRFFGDNEAVKLQFFSEDNKEVSLLAIRLGASIHQVHRPDVCLTSGGGRVLFDRKEIFPLADGDELAASVMDVSFGNARFLILSWFTNPDYSVGNYLAFRAAWTPSGEWQSYLLQTPILQGDRAAAETVLRSFIELFREKDTAK